MENQVIAVSPMETLQAINRSEVDIQISTAKQWPRNIEQSLNRIRAYATIDTETAEDCFYALRRGNGSNAQVIEGISVRLAEIIAGAWGNLRVQTRIIGNDGRTITAQGICHDLETNIAVSVEVKRRITYSNGATYSEDMQVVTGNAASAIAFRNAVLKVVPKAVTAKVIQEIKRVAMGKSIDVETKRQNMLAYYSRLGVSCEDILDYCGVDSVDKIDASMIFELSGVKNAIKEGTTSVQEVFRRNKINAEKVAEEAKSKAINAKKKADKAAMQAMQTAGQESFMKQPE